MKGLLRNTILILLCCTSMALKAQSLSVDSVMKITMMIDQLQNDLADSSMTMEQQSFRNVRLAQLYLLIDENKAVAYWEQVIDIERDAQSANYLMAVQHLADFYKQKDNLSKAYYYSKEATACANRLIATDSSAAQTSVSVISPWQVLLTTGRGRIVLVLSLLLLTGIGFIVRFKKANQQLAGSLSHATTNLTDLSRSDSPESTSAPVIMDAATKQLMTELEALNKEELMLKKQLKQVEEADYLKNTFLANLSHEIRTPLNGIIGFSDLLETELAVMGNSELFDFTNLIQQSSFQIMGLLDNIIDISSLEANMMEMDIQFEHFDRVSKKVEDFFADKAKEKGIIFKVKTNPDLPALKVDKEKLFKAMKLLVDNAIKYTDKGFVTISSDYNAEKNIAVIQIRDTGCGIDESTLKGLMDTLHYGISEKSHVYQGKGLGLILAHRFVLMMKGKLSINSQAQQGTQITLAIPCEGDQVESAVTREEAPVAMVGNPLEQLNIFILEDDRMNRLVLEKMLKKAKKITMAVDGEDALTQIAASATRGEIFDVMLFDMQLPPPWDGTKVMKEVRNQYPDYRKIPFIVQTAFAMSGDRDSYLAAGFDDYISKPIDKNELLTMILKHRKIYQG